MWGYEFSCEEVVSALTEMAEGMEEDARAFRDGIPSEYDIAMAEIDERDAAILRAAIKMIEGGASQ